MVDDVPPEPLDDTPDAEPGVAGGLRGLSQAGVMRASAAELDAAQLTLPLQKIGPFLRGSVGGRS